MMLSPSEMLRHLEPGPQTFGPEVRSCADFLVWLREIKIIEEMPNRSFRAELTDEGRRQLYPAARPARQGRES